MARPSIGDDVLDTRDIDEMIEDLKAEIEVAEGAEEPELEIDANIDEMHLLRLREELESLEKFKDELEDYCDWDHGETLIHADYRTTWTRQFAEDIGAVGDNSDWIKIDWEATAAELFRYDYTSAEVDGETYYVRTC